MGLTKQYLRYKPHATFNILGSGRGGAVFANLSGSRGRGTQRVVAVAAAQNIIIWDWRRQEKVRVLEGDKHEVTCLARVPTAGADASVLLAAGYHDGTIRLWNMANGELEVTFHGHKSAVTCLDFDKKGLRLVSGGRDTHVIVWDVVAESGLYRLHGHKGPVSAVTFLETQNVVVTASKDTYVKFWDLATQHCFKTLTGHVTEVWDLVLLHDETTLVTGGADPELRIWKLQFAEKGGSSSSNGVAVGTEPSAKKGKVDVDHDVKTEGETEDDKSKMLVTKLEDNPDDDGSHLTVTKLGSILRAGDGRLVGLTVDPTGRVMAAHGTDHNIEFFLVCTHEEVQKRLAKKARKERKRTGGGETDPADNLAAPTVQDQFRRLRALRAGGKVKSADLQLVSIIGDDRESIPVCQALMVLANNQLEMATCLLEKQPKGQDESAVGKNKKKKKKQSGQGEDDADEKSVLTDGVAVSRLHSSGHRSDVRTVAISSDNTAVLTASSESVKVWNRSSQACVRTMPSGYALSSLFAPGDRHVIIGTKAGKLQIFDLGSGVMTEEVAAHNSEIWSLAFTADQRGIVSASSDKTVKFWDFELVSPASAESGGVAGEKVLSLLHRRTLQLDEGATCVSTSADGRLVAVALLDSTVKVFFVDTLKFFLSLYGHKLPVVAMDISSDSTLIATGSADRNVKIWGLDFGDCHKSLFAHDETVTGLKFLHNTHMFFTCGKDGLIKQWDADNFQRIVTLTGHLGEVWSLGVSPNAKWVVSAGKDRTVRLWEKTNEIVVLDDERETEREEAAENEVGDSAPVPGEQGKETSLPSRRTAETERGAERLMEAIQLYKDYMSAAATEGAAAQMPPLMMAYNAESPLGFVCDTVTRIRSSELEETLLVLPLDVVKDLMEILLEILEDGKMAGEVEVITRCLLFLLEIHHGPILANKSFEGLVLKLRGCVSRELTTLRDEVGTNLAGLTYLQQQLADRHQVEMFADATQRVRDKNRKKKKKEKALQRAVLAL